MSKRKRQRAARRELKRLENAGLPFYWEIGLSYRNDPVGEVVISAEDIDDAPENENQLLWQAADNAMRPHVQAAIAAYRKALEEIANG